LHETSPLIQVPDTTLNDRRCQPTRRRHGVVSHLANSLGRLHSKGIDGGRWLLWILCLAVAARLLFVVLFPADLSLDTSAYDRYAQHVIAGSGYTRFEDRSADSDLPPLYPLLLVTIYRLLGRGAVQVAMVQAVLECATITLLFLIGQEVFDTSTGLTAAAIYAGYPYMFYQTLTANDTGLFTLLLALAVWLCYRAKRVARWPYAAGTGAALGLATLTKPWGALVLPMVGLWWLGSPRWRRALPLLAGAALGWLLVVSPWIARNTRLHGKLTFVSTNDGSNLYQGNNPCVVDYLRRGWDAQWVDCLRTPPEGLDEIALNHWYRQQAFDYLRSHPGDWWELSTVKLGVLWSPALAPSRLPPGVTSTGATVRRYYTPAFDLARWLHLATFTPILILGLIGAALAVMRAKPIGPLLAILVADTLTYVAFHPSTRYRAPADAFLIVLASASMVALWRRIGPGLRTHHA
jgi:4-amino-4-deoxy-L-arabinose transferase-like glycosyltransferase